MAMSFGNKPTGRPPSSHGQTTNRSVDNGLDSSQRGKRTLRSQSSSNTIESGRRSSNVSLTSGIPDLYNVGDHVDSLCTVQNGTQRWFPGVVLARVLNSNAIQTAFSASPDHEDGMSQLNQSYLYEIQFNDGEIKSNVPPSDMRASKNSRSRTSSRNGSPRSAPQGLNLGNTNPPATSTHQGSHPMVHILEDNSISSDRSYTKSLLSLEGSDCVERPQTSPVSTQVNNGIALGSSTSLPPLQQIFQDQEVNTASSGYIDGILISPPQVQRKTLPPHFRSELRQSESLGSISLDDRLDISYDDEDDEHIFVIPRVYSKQDHQTELSQSTLENRKQSKSGVMVPRMQLENLDLTASLDHGAPSGSLSGSLLREAPIKKLAAEVHQEMNLENLSPRGAVDKILGDLSRDDSSTQTRIESWRDSAGWTTRRSSGVGVPRSSRLGTSHASSNSLFSLLHPTSTHQSNQEALKLIHVAVADISTELNSMVDLVKTYETIISMLFYYAVTELSENQTPFPSVHRFSFASLYSKSEMSSSPARTNSNASASKMESHMSHDISHDFDEFETFPTPEKKEFGHAKQILFSIREFLNSGLPGISNSHILTSLSYIGPNAMRLMKLSSILSFELVCLPSHLRNSDRISSGSFGSVYRLCCPDSCFKGIIPNISQHYAVKKIPRERSIHDPPVIFDIYTEITSLETMSSFLGVCDLINYGIFEGDYWIIMEQGLCDLKDWVVQHLSSEAYRDPSLSSQKISCHVDHFLLQLYIYSECLSIVKAVHDSGIIHFDIKCNNFVIRKVPNLDEMCDAASKHKLSGAVFLADFGESLFKSDCDYPNKIKHRARGTLPIQSPEMLCLNNDTQKYKNVRSSKFQPSQLCDIWSLGCLLYEILVGNYLFENKSWTELFCMLCMEKYQPPDVVKLLSEVMIHTSIPPIGNISHTAGEIILAILQQNPRDRPQLTDTLGEIQQIIISILPFRSRQSQAPPNQIVTHYPSQLASLHLSAPSTQSEISAADPGLVASPTFPFGSTNDECQTFLSSGSNTLPLTKQNLDVVSGIVGSWIMNSQVSINLGYVFSQGIECDLSGKITIHDSFNHRTIPVYSPTRSNLWDSGWRIQYPTSLDEYVNATSSTMSQGQCVNKFQIERSLLRSLHNHCHSCTPSLSYFNMSSSLSCDSRTISAHILSRYAITLTSDSQLPSFVSDTSSVSIIRISKISSMLSLNTRDEFKSFLGKYRFTNGTYCHTFISPTQHLCLILESLPLEDLYRVIFATLKYALFEITHGRSVAICVDPLTGDNGVTTSSHSNALKETSPSAHEAKSKVSYSKLCLTIGIFLVCSTDAAEEFLEPDLSCLPQNVTGSTRGEKIANLLERAFYWVISFLDMNLFRQLCLLSNNYHHLDLHKEESTIIHF